LMKTTINQSLVGRFSVKMLVKILNDILQFQYYG